MTKDLNSLAREVHEANRAKGFWDDPRSLCETTMLIVTELAEAVEEERAGRPSVWYGHDAGGETIEWYEDEVAVDAHGLVRPDDNPSKGPFKPEGIDIELVDALIRLLDLLGSRDVDVDELLKQKLAFNRTRGVRHNKSY